MFFKYKIKFTLSPICVLFTSVRSCLRFKLTLKYLSVKCNIYFTMLGRCKKISFCFSQRIVLFLRRIENCESKLIRLEMNVKDFSAWKDLFVANTYVTVTAFIKVNKCQVMTFIYNTNTHSNSSFPLFCIAGVETPYLVRNPFFPIFAS